MKVLVAGMGKSGFAAAKLALEQGHAVTACDIATSDGLSVDLSPLLARGLLFYGGSMSPNLLQGVEAVILSPGVPRRSDLVRTALRAGIPVLGEIEWAFRHARGRVLAVTGSNGKSTTTTLAGELLASRLPDVRVGGNLGRPFSDMVAEDSEETWHVLELSSFQLESLDTFRASIAVLLNVTPDHQDRYDSFADYAAAKGQVFRNQEASDWAVFSADDAEAARLAGASAARKAPFSTGTELLEGAFVRREAALWRRGGSEEVLFSRSDLPLPGLHNLENALAACLAARLAGVPEGALAEPLRRFRGLPHRLERVATVKGAHVYNDSKATNTDAVLKALTAFERGVILLLGGKDKGADFAVLLPEIRRCAKAVLCFGAAAAKAEAALKGAGPRVERFDSLAAATRRALELAEPGDSVVLSPACASFDEFENFEDRGRKFTAWVRGEEAP